jgi:Mlc titration factor MtfA (ptsG expression regulator)
MNKPGCRPSWKQPFLQALRESDKQRLRELVVAAEHAIILRQQELKHSSDHREERSEMQVAIAALLTLNVYKLGSRSLPHSHSASSTLA